MEIYLIRHGETDFNRKGIVQGGGVDSDLNKLGQRQAQAFFDYYKSISFSAIYSSQLKRTQQTLKPWVDEFGFEINVEPGFVEMSWGILEGKIPTPQESEDFRQLKIDWQNGLFDRKVQGGESPLECWARLDAALTKIKSKHSGERILICSHGRTGRVLLSQLAGAGLQDMEQFNHSNTGLNILKSDSKGQLELELINDTRHLEVLKRKSNEHSY